MRAFTKISGLGALMLFGLAGVASADPVLTAECPDEINATSGRNIGIASDVEDRCFAYGTGNVPQGQDITFPYSGPSGDTTYSEDDRPWDFLESLTWEGSAASSGYLYITGDYSSLDGIFGVMIKTGNNADPSWAFFLLEELPSSLFFSITNPANDISHADLFICYSRDERCQPPEYDVPEPGTLGLLGLGLAGLGFGVRRRRKI